MKKLLSMCFAGLALAACETAPAITANVDNDYRASEVRSVSKSSLNKLQTPSIRENREYCAYVGENPDGVIAMSAVTKGDASSCSATMPEAEGWTVVASVHTHAGYDPAFNSETPSSNDVEVDAFEGTDGYVSTPGGRFWYVDGDRETVTLLCGVGCLTKDPRFEDEAGGIRSSYTLSELKSNEG